MLYNYFLMNDNLSSIKLVYKITFHNLLKFKCVVDFRVSSIIYILQILLDSNHESHVVPFQKSSSNRSSSFQFFHVLVNLQLFSICLGICTRTLLDPIP